MHHSTSFFGRHQKVLLLAASLYVVGLILSHATLPPAHVWVIAAVFSVLMNLVYIFEARAQDRLVRTELLVMGVLITASCLGAILHPLFVIGAIIGHGLWDVAKHFGAGIPFFSWYTWSCAAVDVTYGLTLFAYWMLAPL